MYPVHDVTGWIAERPEALGSKEKFWLIPPTHVPPPRPHLFKLGRHNTGENWAEKACCEILKSLGIPCAEYNFAIHEGRRGVISERFFQDGGSFVPANMILSRLDPEYDGSLQFKQVRYKLLTAISMLRRLQLQLPQGFGKLYPGMAAHELFIGYLVFDALVGNTDRHHENWGVVVTAENNHAGYYLAPSFDHASSLGRDLTDENRQRRLETRR